MAFTRSTLTFLVKGRPCVFDLRFGFLEIGEAEKAMGKALMEVTLPNERGNVTIGHGEILDILFPAMRGQHGIQTREQAAAVLDENARRFSEIATVVLTIINESFPLAEDADEAVGNPVGGGAAPDDGRSTKPSTLPTAPWNSDPAISTAWTYGSSGITSNDAPGTSNASNGSEPKEATTPRL